VWRRRSLCWGVRSGRRCAISIVPKYGTKSNPRRWRMERMVEESESVKLRKKVKLLDGEEVQFKDGSKQTLSKELEEKDLRKVEK
jgi:hypothetical protein